MLACPGPPKSPAQHEASVAGAQGAQGACSTSWGRFLLSQSTWVCSALCPLLRFPVVSVHTLDLSTVLSPRAFLL